MRDLVVVNPGGAHGIYGALASDITAVEPPLWARLIAGYVSDHGFRVSIVDADALGASPKAAAVLALTHRPGAICVAAYGHQPSASTQTMPWVEQFVKEINGERNVLIVGGHAAALTDRTVLDNKNALVCTGEGPRTALEIVCKVPWNNVHDLAYWDGNAVVKTERAPLLNVAELIGDAWMSLPMKRYRSHNWQRLGAPDKRRPYASVYTSLGCPYRCTFCCINAPFGTNAYRMREPRDVVREFEYLWRAHRVKTFKIVDEMFVLNKKHYTAIAEGLVESRKNGRLPNDISIWAYARVDTISPENLGLLRSAGFDWLALGIESGSALVRDGAEKRLKTADIVGTVRAVQAADINVVANYIFGLPDDTLQTMGDTVELAEECNAEWANFYVAMAYPGSRLYTEAVAAGRDLPDTWAGYSQHNADCKPLANDHCSSAEILEFRDRAFLGYFNNRRWLDMIARKFGDQAIMQVNAMLRVKLRRNLLEETV